MKYSEYDSPFVLNMSDITMQMSQKIDEMCWNAVQRVGIDIDKEKLLTALNQDSERYRKAYANGYDTGYKERDEEIVRCKDCRHWDSDTRECTIKTGWFACGADWFCASGEKAVKDDE